MEDWIRAVQWACTALVLWLGVVHVVERVLGRR